MCVFTQGVFEAGDLGTDIISNKLLKSKSLTSICYIMSDFYSKFTVIVVIN